MHRYRGALNEEGTAQMPSRQQLDAHARDGVLLVENVADEATRAPTDNLGSIYENQTHLRKRYFTADVVAN